MNQQPKKTYFVTGGGTGGHIYPAISIAKALRAEPDTDKVYYIGNPNNMESRIAQQEGFDFLSVNVTAMPRKINFDLLKWGFKLDKATLKALFYIYKYKPNAIFGTGGYVSAPAIIAGWLSSTPYMIHDSDAHPGIVSRYVAHGAKCISVAFEEAKKHINNSNVNVYGNPIKTEFFHITNKEAKQKLGFSKEPVLLVMGGSQGAMNINYTLINCIKYFAEELKLGIILQTGAKNYDASIELINKIYPEYTKNPKIIIKPYFDNMAIPMKAADLVIARAGSLSLSEIAAAEVPSILIPFAYAAADHQRKNAHCYESAGASIYIDDSELNKPILEQTVHNLFKNPNKLKQMKEAVKAFSKPDATYEIVKALKEISK